MAKRRKTTAERRAEQDQQDSRAIARFYSELNGANTYVEAKKLAFEPLPAISAARQLYSNLAYFVNNLLPPGGASRIELQSYIRLVERIELPTGYKGSKDSLLISLRSAINSAYR